MNISLDNGNKIRIINFSSANYYDIGDINFYIPIAKKNYQVFLILRTKKNLYEILKLTQLESSLSNSNILYKLELNQKIRINKEPVALYLLLINSDTNDYIQSNEINININTERYHCARRVAIVESAGKDIYNLYIKILSMYNDLKKGVDGE